jgi:hypothetical protein
VTQQLSLTVNSIRLSGHAEPWVRLAVSLERTVHTHHADPYPPGEGRLPHPLAHTYERAAPGYRGQYFFDLPSLHSAIVGPERMVHVSYRYLRAELKNDAPDIIHRLMTSLDPQAFLGVVQTEDVRLEGSVLPFETQRLVRADPSTWTFGELPWRPNHTRLRAHIRASNSLIVQFPLETTLHWKELDQLRRNLSRYRYRPGSRNQNIVLHLRGGEHL